MFYFDSLNYSSPEEYLRSPNRDYQQCNDIIQISDFLRKEQDDCFSAIEPLKSPPIYPLVTKQTFCYESPLNHYDGDSAKSTDIRRVNSEDHEQKFMLIDDFPINTLFDSDLNKCVDAILNNQDNVQEMTFRLESLYPQVSRKKLLSSFIIKHKTPKKSRKLQKISKRVRKNQS